MPTSAIWSAASWNTSASSCSNSASDSPLWENQYRLAVGDQEFYIDLLFYHLKLRAYVVIDPKMKAFEPEFAGKMNFYLSAVNDLLRHPDDQPSIGLILCKTCLSPNTRSATSTSPSAYPNTGSPRVFPTS